MKVEKVYMKWGSVLENKVRREHLEELVGENLFMVIAQSECYFFDRCSPFVVFFLYVFSVAPRITMINSSLPKR